MIPSENLIELLPLDGAVLVCCQNGEIVSVEHLRDKQFVATVPVFIELAEKAGYTISMPDI
ncbi:hypothetical protein [Yersinia aleksiciae]|uniref:Phage-like protein n=1 Tax=Yersinia aleksiciae TaxID=263819 RepID=A0A0T9UVV3_YERAE|nr:hypothetical protein [Yersinia aleksiciae]MDA5496820.1 hypothetical protein [Yersinia aleksiciae]NIK98797.1 hypothetical protein [Yersinia aleksiciae]WQC72296.1 hypothetical protein N0K21_07730 [Yersinia aleksiciae]CFQ33514.1 phage-like protein [Yersinia aleksiciae]CNL76541.1 phage-like protein [Yersinia aleksiciae]